MPPSCIPVHFEENDIFDLLSPFCEFYTDRELGNDYKAVIFGERFNNYQSYFTGQVKIKVKSFRRKIPAKIQSRCGAFIVTVDRIHGYNKDEAGINFV